jgi:hypothetical protein
VGKDIDIGEVALAFRPTQQAFVFQSAQKPEGDGALETRSLYDFRESQGLLRV